MIHRSIDEREFLNFAKQTLAPDVSARNCEITERNDDINYLELLGAELSRCRCRWEDDILHNLPASSRIHSDVTIYKEQINILFPEYRICKRKLPQARMPENIQRAPAREYAQTLWRSD
jgi:hypothetical protein